MSSSKGEQQLAISCPWRIEPPMTWSCTAWPSGLGAPAASRFALGKIAFSLALALPRLKRASVDELALPRCTHSETKCFFMRRVVPRWLRG